MTRYAWWIALLSCIAIISYLKGYHEGEERSIHAVYKVYKAQVPWECS